MPWTYDSHMATFAQRDRRPETTGSSGHGGDRPVRVASAASLERLAYTVEEAAAVVGVGRDLLYDEIRTGRLRSKKAGARRVIARHHLLEWLDGDVGEPDRRAS